MLLYQYSLPHSSVILSGVKIYLHIYMYINKVSYRYNIKGNISLIRYVIGCLLLYIVIVFVHVFLEDIFPLFGAL